MSAGIAQNLPVGLYVLSKDKSVVIARIDDLSKQFFFTLEGKQVVAKCKECQQRVLLFLNESFEDTRAREKCKLRFQSYFTDDINLAREYGQRMLDFLFQLKGTMKLFVPFEDLPSCRSLLDCSVEEAIVKAADLCGSGIVKATAHVLSIGSEVYKIKNIEDVRHYYNDYLVLFQRDVEEGWKLSPVEQVFLIKAKIELEYCQLAVLKTAGKLTKDVLEISRELIEGYRINNQQANVQQVR